MVVVGVGRGRGRGSRPGTSVNWKAGEDSDEEGHA